MALPTDSSHLSDQVSDELIEEFSGLVEKQFAKHSIMRQYAKVRNVTGTDTLINRRLGRTQLQKVIAGVRPDAKPTNTGRVQVTVDTIVLARDNQSLLNEFQADFDVRSELAEDQGKELGKFFDEAFIIQGIKGANAAAPTGLNGALGAGKNVKMAALGDENDPDKLEDAIASILVLMQEEDIDTDECVIFVRPAKFRTLYKNDKLVSKEFSPSNGDYAKAMVMTLAGSRIVQTARIPTAAIAGHKLSNPTNSNAYDVSATEALAVAVIIHPKSLLAGETIPLTSDIYYEKTELQWFIDSYIAFAVTVNRPDVCGAVFSFF